MLYEKSKAKEDLDTGLTGGRRATEYQDSVAQSFQRISFSG